MSASRTLHSIRSRSPHGMTTVFVPFMVYGGVPAARKLVASLDS